MIKNKGFVKFVAHGLPFRVHWRYTSARECCRHYQERSHQPYNALVPTERRNKKGPKTFPRSIISVQTTPTSQNDLDQPIRCKNLS